MSSVSSQIELLNLFIIYVVLKCTYTEIFFVLSTNIFLYKHTFDPIVLKYQKTY